MRGLLRRERVEIVQVFFHDSTCFGVPVAWLARVPCVVRTKRNVFHALSAAQRRFRRIVMGFYNRFRVDAMIVNSEACRSAVLALESPAPRRIERIPNGVNLLPFQTATRTTDPTSTTPRRVGVVAMLRREKRLDLFIEAARLVADQCPDVEFAIAGEGEMRPKLEQLIESLGLTGRVTLWGRRADIPQFVADLDVAVLCSSSEGLPNAVIEYMAAGKAIVSTDIAGAAELIEHEVSGLLTPSGDAPGPARQILRLLDDQELSRALE